MNEPRPNAKGGLKGGNGTTLGVQSVKGSRWPAAVWTRSLKLLHMIVNIGIIRPGKLEVAIGIRFGYGQGKEG